MNNDKKMESFVLHPIDGCYQSDKSCKLVRETKTMIVVQADGELGTRRFRKSDNLEVSPLYRFPAYTLKKTTTKEKNARI